MQKKKKKKKELGLNITRCTKINSKQIIDVNEYINLHTFQKKKKNRKNLCDLGLGKENLDMTPKAQRTKEKN